MTQTNPHELARQRKTFKRIVGIDPGQHTGVAIYDRVSKEWVLRTEDFWSAYDILKTFSRETTLIVIETPRKFMYARNDKFTGPDVRNRMSSDMGGNRREAELLAARFESLGFTVNWIVPAGSKWCAKTLKRYTGITARTNEHVRDAVRLAFLHI